MRNKIKVLLIVLIALVFLFPFLLWTLECPIVTQSLDGYFIKKEEPVYSTGKWFDGTYQEEYNKYTEENIYGRDFLVRLYNQYRFNLYHQATAAGTLIGKKRVLYQDFYVDALLGRDRVPEELIRKQVRDFKTIQDSLRQNNITLILAIAPGKASFYPEFLPDSIDQINRPSNNYELYTRELDKAGCDYLDLRKFLLSKKQDSPHPLFPRNGTHWSGYAITLVTDTLAGYIEAKTDFDLTDFHSTGGYKTEHELRFTDNDIGKALNLLIPQRNWPMYYPVLVFTKGKTRKPNLLSIGDSFNQSFWGFYPFFDELFGDTTHYWYYNRVLAWPDSLEKFQIDVKNLDLYKEVNDRDIILIVTTEQNLKDFCFNFINEYLPYTKLDPASYLQKRQSYIDQIKSDNNWLESIKKKASEQHQPLDVMIRRDAEWMIQNEK